MVSSKSRKSNDSTQSRYWDSVVTLHFCLSYSLYKGHGSTPFDSYSHNCYQASLKKKNLCFGKCLSEKWRLQLRCLRGLCHEYFKKVFNRILGLKAYNTCAKYALNYGIIDLWHLIWGWWEYLPQLRCHRPRLMVPLPIFFTKAGPSGMVRGEIEWSNFKAKTLKTERRRPQL